MNDPFAPTIPTVNLVHHFLRVRVMQNNLVDDVALIPGFLSNDGGHWTDIEVHSNKQSCVGTGRELDDVLLEIESVIHTSLHVFEGSPELLRIQSRIHVDADGG